MVPEFIDLAVVDRQYRFGVFGGDAEEGDQPHPEHGTGATDGNRAGHPGDIARADRGRQRCHQGLEWRNIAFVDGVGCFQQHPGAVSQAQNRHEAESDHQDNACDRDQADGGPTPCERINRSVDGVDQPVDP